MLEKYGHGGDLRSASELFGIAEGELLDYSSNMNPHGPPASFKTIIERYWHDIIHYPDPVQRDVIAAIASRHQLAHEQIIVGNGAAELIDLVVRYIKPSKAAILVPSFVEYEQAIVKAGCELVTIETSEATQFMPTREQLSRVIDECSPLLYLLGYPNNPTGTLLPIEQLLKLLDSGAYVVVDEAFLDFHPDEDRLTMFQWLNRYERLFVIRSMTKFYAIPGIRLGYMAGANQHIQAMKQLQSPWSVNSLAQKLGAAAFDETAYIAKTKAWLVEEISWLTGELEQLGLQPHRTVTNYMLVRLTEQINVNSKQLQQEMGMYGVLIRDASTFRGLTDRYIRLAIKDRTSNKKLLHILEQILKRHRREGWQG